MAVTSASGSMFGAGGQSFVALALEGAKVRQMVNRQGNLRTNKVARASPGS